MTTRNPNDLIIHRDTPPKALKHRGTRNQRKAAVRPRLRYSRGASLDSATHYRAGERARQRRTATAAVTLDDLRDPLNDSGTFRNNSKQSRYTREPKPAYNGFGG